MPGVPLAVGAIIGRLSPSAINFLTPLLYLFTSCDKLATSLVSRVFVAANSVMDDVRGGICLDLFTHVVLPVVTTVSRLSKQPSNLLIVTGVPLPPGVSASPEHALSTAPPNWSCPPTA